MATSLIIEEEHGTYVGFVHRHNGYYAGDFSQLSATSGPLGAPAVSRSRAPATPVRSVPAAS